MLNLTVKCFCLLNLTVKCYTQDLAVHSDLTDQLTTGTRADSVGDCQRRDPHRGAQKAAFYDSSEGVGASDSE